MSHSGNHLPRLPAQSSAHKSLWQQHQAGLGPNHKIKLELISLESISRILNICSILLFFPDAQTEPGLKRKSVHLRKRGWLQPATWCQLKVVHTL